MDNYKDTINNTILKISTLEKEYDLYLKQYQEAYKNYINILNTSSNPCEKYKLESKGISQECYNKIWSDQGCTTQAPTIGDWQKDQTYDGLVKDSYLWATLTDADHRKGCYGDATEYTTNTEPTYSLGKEYTELPGRTWWGTYGLKEGAASTKEDCMSMCASDSECTGATFNPVKRYCWTRGGDGTISVGSNDEVALIPKLKAVVIVLSGLNEKLMSINEELRSETKKITPKLKEEKLKNEKNQQKFDEYYNDLYHDKVEMAKLLNEYTTIDSELNNQTLFVDQQNLSFRLWFLLALILFFVVVKKMKGSTGSPSADFIINKLFILFILISIFTINKPAGFATMGFFLVAFIVYKMNSSSSVVETQ
jgi:hypothetical protein